MTAKNELVGGGWNGEERAARPKHAIFARFFREFKVSWGETDNSLATQAIWSRIKAVRLEPMARCGRGFADYRGYPRPHNLRDNYQ